MTIENDIYEAAIKDDLVQLESLLTSQEGVSFIASDKNYQVLLSFSEKELSKRVYQTILRQREQPYSIKSTIEYAFSNGNAPLLRFFDDNHHNLLVEMSSPKFEKTIEVGLSDLGRDLNNRYFSEASKKISTFWKNVSSLSEDIKINLFSENSESSAIHQFSIKAISEVGPDILSIMEPCLGSITDQHAARTYIVACIIFNEPEKAVSAISEWKKKGSQFGIEKKDNSTSCHPYFNNFQQPEDIAFKAIESCGKDVLGKFGLTPSTSAIMTILKDLAINHKCPFPPEMNSYRYRSAISVPAKMNSFCNSMTKSLFPCLSSQDIEMWINTAIEQCNEEISARGLPNSQVWSMIAANTLNDSYFTSDKCNLDVFEMLLNKLKDADTELPIGYLSLFDAIVSQYSPTKDSSRRNFNQSVFQKFYDIQQIKRTCWLPEKRKSETKNIEVCLDTNKYLFTALLEMVDLPLDKLFNGDIYFNEKTLKLLANKHGYTTLLKAAQEAGNERAAENILGII